MEHKSDTRIHPIRVQSLIHSFIHPSVRQPAQGLSADHTLQPSHLSLLFACLRRRQAGGGRSARRRSSIAITTIIIIFTIVDCTGGTQKMERRTGFWIGLDWIGFWMSTPTDSCPGGRPCLRRAPRRLDLASHAHHADAKGRPDRAPAEARPPSSRGAASSGGVIAIAITITITITIGV